MGKFKAEFVVPWVICRGRRMLPVSPGFGRADTGLSVSHCPAE